MNAVSGSILAVLLAVVFCGSRRWALLGMMGGVFFLTQGHSLDVAGVNMYPLRFLGVAACIRVLLRGELARLQLNRTDWALLLLYNYGALVWIIRSTELSAHQLASAMDPALFYIAIRALLIEFADLQWLLRAFAVLLVPFAALVFLERLTGQSPFALVGMTSSLYVRNGVPRCQGSFRHPVLLGSVAAAFFSLYIGSFLAQGRRALDLAGAFLCVVLVILTNSGGPLTSLGTAVAGWLTWPLRRSMRAVRGSMAVILILVALVMNAPIWYLPFKISALVGGTGWHRGVLMDNAWRDLNKWWLAGMDMDQTIGWFPYMLEIVGGADITNQYLVYGLRAGVGALALSIILLVYAFKDIGRSLAVVRASASMDEPRELLVWGIGVSIAVHAVSWIGVSYFDQSWAVWILHLAAVSTASHSLRSPSVTGPKGGNEAENGRQWFVAAQGR